MTELEASLLSIAIEAPTALVLVRYAVRAGPGAAARAAAAAVAGTLVSHPFAWAGNAALGRSVPWPVTAAIVEAAVILAEAVVYAAVARLRPWPALAVSAAANVASFGVGLAIWAIG
jgi:hypothetical protein